jgi:hypothetical protein
MFIFELCLSAILWSALGAIIAACIIIGTTAFLLCIVVFASPSGAIMPSGKKRGVLSKSFERPQLIWLNRPSVRF